MRTPTSFMMHGRDTAEKFSKTDSGHHEITQAAVFRGVTAEFKEAWVLSILAKSLHRH